MKLHIFFSSSASFSFLLDMDLLQVMYLWLKPNNPKLTAFSEAVMCSELTLLEKRKKIFKHI